MENMLISMLRLSGSRHSALRGLERRAGLALILAVCVIVGLLGNSGGNAAFAAAQSGDSTTPDASQASNRVQPPANVYAGRVAGDANSTRLYFDLDRKIEYKSFLMEEPRRVVIDVPSVLFRFENPDDLEPRGLVSFLRYGTIGGGRSRIVISLSGPAAISAISMQKIEPSGRYRLLLDLTSVSAEEFRQSVESQRELLGKSGETAVKGDRVRPVEKKEGHFVIVIDPGHGGIDGGAKGANGTQEKDVTLEIAKKLAEKIAAVGPFDVKLTRESDVFVSLGERVAFAKRNEAELMISIHADTLRQKWVRGASIYTLSDKASDALAEQLAESENMADIAAGLNNPVEEEAVQGILADFTARETRGFSLAFSSTLSERLASGIKMIKNPRRSASFVVLKASDVPGVLLELGYLSNSEDEKLLTDPDWQEELSRLISNAILTFFKPRM